MKITYRIIDTSNLEFDNKKHYYLADKKGYVVRFHKKYLTNKEYITLKEGKIINIYNTKRHKQVSILSDGLHYVFDCLEVCLKEQDEK